MVRQPMRGEDEEEGQKKKIDKHLFFLNKCFCPCSDSIKELREWRLHNTRVNWYCIKCAHALYFALPHIKLTCMKTQPTTSE